MTTNKIFYDDQMKTVSLNDKQSVKLTGFEYSLFKKLVENTNSFTSSDELVHYMWKDEAVSNKKDNSNLIQLVSKLRRQLSIFDDMLSIDGKRGIGYCLSIYDDCEVLDKTNYSLTMLSSDLSTAFKEDFNKEIAKKTTKFKFRDLSFVALLSFFMASFYFSKQIKIPEIKSLSELGIKSCSEEVYISSGLKCELIDEVDDDYTYVYSKYSDSIFYSRMK